jgi:hypothetical protein
MNYIFLYSIYDTLALLLSLVVAMALGEPYQPHPVVFVIVFFSTRSVLYYLWFNGINKLSLPWFPLAIHTVCLLVALPVLIAVANLLLLKLSDALFWFGVVPTVSLVVSYALHHFYKLPQL